MSQSYPKSDGIWRKSQLPLKFPHQVGWRIGQSGGRERQNEHNGWLGQTAQICEVAC